MEKQARGTMESFVEKNTNTVVVKWHDNKCVTLISSYLGEEPRDKCRRWSKTEKKFLEVDRPHIVQEYNRFMGGIDLIDACVAKYKYHMRSRRWYLYLFWQTITLAVVNSWMLYKRACKFRKIKPQIQRKFQSDIATSLLLVNATRKPGRPTSCDGAFSPVPVPPKKIRLGPVDDVRKDQVGHWPVKCEKRGRCKVCTVNNTDTLCEKCDVRLCFTHERNCFKLFHTG
jgi:hypothetical protein